MKTWKRPVAVACFLVCSPMAFVGPVRGGPPAPVLVRTELERKQDGLVLLFVTDRPVPGQIELVPPSRPPPDARRTSDRPRLLHRVLLDRSDLAADRLVIISTIDETRTIRIGDRLVPGLPSVVSGLEQRLSAVDPASALEAARRTEQTARLPDSAAWTLERRFATHREDLSALRWCLPLVLSDRSFPPQLLASAYRLARPWMLIDAACQALSIPFSTGMSASLPGVFAPHTRAPFSPAVRRSLVLPRADVPFLPEGTPSLFDAGALQSTKTAEEVATGGLDPGAARAARAACLFLPVPELEARSHRDNTFEIDLDDRVRLLMRFPERDLALGAARPPGLYHTVDPRLLVGIRRIGITMPPLPGLGRTIGEVRLQRLEIWTSGP